MGRPKEKPGEQRLTTNLRLQPAELRMIKQAAKLQGLQWSSWLRMVSLERAKEVPKEKSDERRLPTNVRFQPAELRMIKRAAHLQGLQWSPWLRMVSLERAKEVLASASEAA